MDQEKDPSVGSEKDRDQQQDQGQDQPEESTQEKLQQKAREADWGQIGLIALVALALIASVIMLLTDSAAALKLALLAALWAAVIGVFLGARYRNEARDAQKELEHREESMRAEIAAIEERSSTVASVPDYDPQVLEDIRKEIAIVRSQLEELSGRALEFEPAALRAEARRIMELEARTMQANSPANTSEMPVVVPEPEDDESDAGEAEVPAPSAFKSHGGVPSPDAVAGRLGAVPRKDIPNPLTELINEKKRAAEAAEPEKTEPEKTEAPKTEAPKSEEPKIEEPEDIEEPGGGRRRRDERTSGVSVAELLARAKKERD